MHVHLAWVCAWDAVVWADAETDRLRHQGPQETSLVQVSAVSLDWVQKRAWTALALSAADQVAADWTHHHAETVVTGEESPGLAKLVAHPVSGCELAGSVTDCPSQMLCLDAGMSTAPARGPGVGPAAQYGLLSGLLPQGLRHLCRKQQTE